LSESERQDLFDILAAACRWTRVYSDGYMLLPAGDPARDA